MTSMTNLVLVHVDPHWIIVNKPPGLLSVPGRGADKQDCLSARIQQDYPDALIVHRLDMATSGLMVLARGPASQRILSAAFANRLVRKTYIAMVAGTLHTKYENWQTIDLPIQVDWPNRPLRIIDPVLGKPSVTRVQSLHVDSLHNITRVALEPVTGRSHQLRVHLKAIGHPILGDALYAPEPVQALSERLLLHATALRLPHPAHSHTMDFESPPEF